MRILLDECVPWPMHKLLAGHAWTTAQKHGWSAMQNGQLLSLAEEEFDLFMTSDQNMRYQQNLSGRRIGILALSTNDLRRIFAASGAIQIEVQTNDPLLRPPRLDAANGAFGWKNPLQSRRRQAE